MSMRQTGVVRGSEERLSWRETGYVWIHKQTFRKTWRDLLTGDFLPSLTWWSKRPRLAFCLHCQCFFLAFKLQTNVSLPLSCLAPVGASAPSWPAGQPEEPFFKWCSPQKGIPCIEENNGLVKNTSWSLHISEEKALFGWRLTPEIFFHKSIHPLPVWSMYLLHSTFTFKAMTHVLEGSRDCSLFFVCVFLHWSQTIQVDIQDVSVIIPGVKKEGETGGLSCSNILSIRNILLTPASGIFPELASDLVWSLSIILLFSNYNDLSLFCLTSFDLCREGTSNLCCLRSVYRKLFKHSQESWSDLSSHRNVITQRPMKAVFSLQTLLSHYMHHCRNVEEYPSEPT